MPIPKPNKGESKKEFIDRCMSNETMKNEYPDDDQRLAVCNTQWDNKESKSDADMMEKRSYALQLEKRADGDESRKLTGHAAVFDEWTLIGGERWGFDEIIRRSAFTESITEDDVRALFNHDANFVLGRNKSGTLELKEDNVGLAITIDPPDSQLVRDMVLTPIDRGDISQMSFAFRVLEDKWTFSDDEKTRDKREIIKVKLYDISPVTYPAYEGTDVALASRDRSLNHKRAENKSDRNYSSEIRRLDIKRKELNI